MAGALAAGALSPVAAGASTLLVQGAGWGHGVGMSQEGALGYASHGFDYRAILAHYYTGTTIGQAPAKAIVRVLIGRKVVRVPLERYVRGVVSAEMPASWPMAALEAQAVASRTYALTAHAGGSRFDVYADTRSQVYAGAAAETAQTNAAVAATAGQIVVYGTNPAQAAATYFFASSGGMTENVEYGFPGAEREPWLRAVADPYDAGTASRWTVEVAFTAAAQRLRGLFGGSLRGIEVLGRGASPRIVSALVLGTRGSSVIDGPQLAGRLGLRSTWAYFSVRRGAHVSREPERLAAGQATGTSGGGAASTPAPGTPAGPQGGAQAPAGASATQIAATGGVAAG